MSYYVSFAYPTYLSIYQSIYLSYLSIYPIYPIYQDPPCDLSQGLAYAVTSQWSNSAINAAGDACTASAGGHYDPYLACSPYSYGKDSCEKMGRAAAQGYAYGCSPAAYEAGNYAQCEGKRPVLLLFY